MQYPIPYTLFCRSIPCSGVFQAALRERSGSAVCHFAPEGSQVSCPIPSNTRVLAGGRFLAVLLFCRSAVLLPLNQFLKSPHQHIHPCLWYFYYPPERVHPLRVHRSGRSWTSTWRRLRTGTFRSASCALHAPRALPCCRSCGWEALEVSQMTC